MDLFELIRQDHRKAQGLLAQLADEEGSSAALELFRQLDHELTWHSEAEEDTFYPKAREATHDDKLIDEAFHEHAETKEMLADLRDLNPMSPEFREKIERLRKSVEHHIQEEESELFPKLRQTLDDGAIARLGTSFREAKTRHMHDDTFVEQDEDDLVDTTEDDFTEVDLEKSSESKRRKGG